MPKDPYATLGVARDASPEDIRQAYRKLAKLNHPDLNPGNKAAEERFKTANAANDLLSDPDKRARFDRGEIDGAGEPRQPAPFGGGGRRRGGAGGGAPFAGADADLQDMFADFLGQAGGQGGPGRPGGPPRRPRDRAYALEIDFLDAVRGATQRVTLPDGALLDVPIPAGVEHGQTIRLPGKGGPGRGPAAPIGDALIEITIRPHKLFTREGADILLELPVTLAEAVLGAKVPVPTPTGSVALSIPAHSGNGTRLRLRGRGVGGTGDQYVTLRLVLDPADQGLAAYLRDRPDAPAFNPRADMRI